VIYTCRRHSSALLYMFYIRRLVSSFQCSCLTNYTDVGLLLSCVLPIVDCLYCPDCSHRLWTSFPDFIGFYRASACYKHAERDIIMANLSVRLSVHCRYCVQTNGYIVAFCRSGIILVFPFSPQLQKFRGTPNRGHVGVNILQVSPYLGNGTR